MVIQVFLILLDKPYLICLAKKFLEKGNGIFHLCLRKVGKFGEKGLIFATKSNEGVNLKSSETSMITLGTLEN